MSGEFLPLERVFEEIVLQALDDLYDPVYHLECLHFFTGERFAACADALGYTLAEREYFVCLALRVHGSRMVGCFELEPFAFPRAIA